jgi:hypothetical protein
MEASLRMSTRIALCYFRAAIDEHAGVKTTTHLLMISCRHASIPRLRITVSCERSKKRDAMRSAPMRSPAAHASRILVTLDFMIPQRECEFATFPAV